jgi:class 3 adenylate cyclase
MVWERCTVPTDQSSDQSSHHSAMSATRVGLQYALAMTVSQLITSVEVAAVIISLTNQTFDAATTYSTPTNLVLLIALILFGLLATAYGGYRSIAPSLKWFVAGVEPDADQRKSAINLVRRQSGILLGVWGVSSIVVIAANPAPGIGSTLLLLGAMLFGGSSSISSSVLFTQRIVRPLLSAASKDFVGRETAPGVTARLVLMWLAHCALPILAIALLVVFHVNGWFIPRSASLVIPVVVLSAVSVGLGLRSLILVSRSISDPLNDVVAAMAEVERGQIGRTVAVYEQSEIGKLQNGFNRMVAGLLERDRLRDLFNRHVGPDVARRAVETDEDQSGEVRDVAILFIDLAGSTQLATTHTPQQVADVLNDFFKIVVAAVDAHGGLINKFQGDAALAVFGAPIADPDAATSALLTARALAEDLRRLPVVDYGIGVSAGVVFAGNIGGESRYEYTVIGDPVNEAARLADAAKNTARRALASGAAMHRAAAAERRRWDSRDPILLRGRAEPTLISVPRGDNGGYGPQR